MVLTTKGHNVKLEDRQAKCTYCKKTVPSNVELAFFEFKGEGSKTATENCMACAYTKIAHERAAEYKESHLARLLDHEFAPRGAADVDNFYCGCRGWD